MRRVSARGGRRGWRGELPAMRLTGSAGGHVVRECLAWFQGGLKQEGLQHPDEQLWMALLSSRDEDCSLRLRIRTVHKHRVCG